MAKSSPHSQAGSRYTKIAEDKYCKRTVDQYVDRATLSGLGKATASRKLPDQTLVWFLRHATPEELERLAALSGASQMNETTGNNNS